MSTTSLIRISKYINLSSVVSAFLSFLSCQSGTALSPSPCLQCTCSVSRVRSLLSSYFSEPLLQQLLGLLLCSSPFILTHSNFLLCSKSLTLARHVLKRRKLILLSVCRSLLCNVFYLDCKLPRAGNVFPLLLPGTISTNSAV